MNDETLLRNLDDSTKSTARHQLETLHSILHRNSGVRYLHPYLGSYDAPIDAATYRRSVPLSSYDDYIDCINQMTDGADRGGDDPLLSVDPLVCFFYSSGTSSMKPKSIPYFDSALSRAASFVAHQGSAAVLRRLFPPRSSAEKALWFIYSGNVTTTKGGFKAMAASAFPIHNNKTGTSTFLSTSISPKEVILGPNVHSQMYCHLLCGLRHFDSVHSIRAPYALALIQAFTLLEQTWDQLCSDIEHGAPSLDRVPESPMRDSVLDSLGGPHPGVSARIRSICGEKPESWEGMLIKLWPNLKFVKCVTTGSMANYYPKLKFYSGSVPLLGGDYFASECCVAVNLDVAKPPESTRYVLLPTGAYFEFLPYHQHQEQDQEQEQETVDVSGVEIGKVYEVIVTTYRGFYRYRLGDIVKVVGFRNSSPELEFLMRAPKSPNEVLTERDLISSMENLRTQLENLVQTEVTEYACFLDAKSDPNRLKLFVEVKDGSRAVESESVRKFGSLFEDGVGGMYKVQRDKGELGGVMVVIVRPGGFGKVFDFVTELGAPCGQYKHPKVIRNDAVADLLEKAALIAVTV